MESEAKYINCRLHPWQSNLTIVSSVTKNTVFLKV